MSALGAPGAFAGRRAGWSRRPAGQERGVPAARVSARVAPIGVVTRDALARERGRVGGRARGRRERARGGGSRFARAAASSSSGADARAEDAPPPPKPPPFEIPAAPPALLRVPDPPEPIENEPDDDDLTDETSATGGLFSFFRGTSKPSKTPAKPRGVRARDIVKETARLTFRDFGSTVSFALVAGAAAQTINLGGTFVLAIFGVHEVELVAALFLVAVQLAKAVAQTTVRVATFRNARDVDCGERSARFRVNPVNAWIATTSALETWRYVLFIDARRLLSVAWNGFLTIPIPYLSVVKVCDYALCVPVFLFEGVHGKECLRRSEELMRGHRLRLLRAGLGVGALMSAAVGVVVGAFAAAVPSLPALLMEPQSSLADAAGGSGVTPKAGNAAMGIFTGTAFDRVWDHGSLAEKWATVILLAFAVLGSFLFSAAVRQLLYVFYRETAARWTPPPPPEEVAEVLGEGDDAPGPVRAFFRKMAFWKKVEEGDLSEAVAARTAELKKEKEPGEGKISDASEKTS